MLYSNHTQLKSIFDISCFADNVIYCATTMEELNSRGSKLQEMFSEYSLFFKRPTEPWDQMEENYEIKEKNTRENLYG